MATLRRSRLLIVGKDEHKRWEFRWGKRQSEHWQRQYQWAHFVVTH